MATPEFQNITAAERQLGAMSRNRNIKRAIALTALIGGGAALASFNPNTKVYVDQATNFLRTQGTELGKTLGKAGAFVDQNVIQSTLEGVRTSAPEVKGAMAFGATALGGALLYKEARPGKGNSYNERKAAVAKLVAEGGTTADKSTEIYKV
jgi:hypothetical protein